MTAETRPGGYDRVLAWLAVHSPATAGQAGKALGITRGRALLVLRTAMLNGDATREPYSATEPYPWQWSVRDAAADDDYEFDLAPSLEDSEYLLDQIHATAGWEYGITLTASTHVQWNAEIRVTPAPHAEDTSDRSYTVLRVGPPEWALNRALQDVLRWLDEVRPPDVSEPCWACEDDPEGYHGKEQENRS